MTQLILIRHGQSIWNERNIFTGWVDIPLSKKGIEEAQKAALLLADTPIDMVFTSTLCRAMTTALIILAYHKSGKTPCLLHPGTLALGGKDTIYDIEEQKRILPVLQSPALNERMYGELQGLNKAVL